MTILIKQSETTTVAEASSTLLASLQAFRGKTIVVKFGGSGLLSQEPKEAFIQQILLLVQAGLKIVVIHGGGLLINETLLKLGTPTKKVHGLRITDATTLDVVMDVLTKINKEFVKDFESAGAAALTIKNIFLSKKLELNDEDGNLIDLGWVGDIQHVDLFAVNRSLASGHIPVLAPIGIDDQGNFYNLNADHAALAMASALQADAIMFLTDVSGVLKDVSDPTSRIPRISIDEIQNYINQGIISGGMLPKLQSCISGIKKGIRQIAIIDGHTKDAVIRGILAPQETGTLIRETPPVNNTANYIERAQNVFINNYSRFPLVLTQGKGCYIQDSSGKSYLDFVSGVAVNVLGHCHSKVIEAITSQANDLIHCSNLYFNLPSINLAEALIKLSGFDKVFFCNSGSEANEAAIKLARKFSKQSKGDPCIEVIAVENSFHGRTLGALSATGQIKHQQDFLPLLKGFKIVPLNMSAIEAAVSANTSAIIIEPIQGEGGVLPVPPEVLSAVRQLCNKNNIALIFDEVQCGIGRTGQFFAYENYCVKPDIVTLAKGLGGGFPIGALLATDKMAQHFQPGDHGATFGGNPVACAAALVVLDEVNQPAFLTHVKEVGTYLKNALIDFKKKHNVIIDVRGEGLMLGVELNQPAKPIVEACVANGLLLVSAGPNMLRFLPPLIISKAEIDEGLAILDTVFNLVSDLGKIK